MRGRAAQRMRRRYVGPSALWLPTGPDTWACGPGWYIGAPLALVSWATVSSGRSPRFERGWHIGIDFRAIRIAFAMALNTNADQGMSQMRQRPQKSQSGTV